ncbi:MAG: FecR domain-containing protein [Chitinophagaceae bacterium]|nr:FecR domain-containing protein [Chitinophagaceae bacterium]
MIKLDDGQLAYNTEGVAGEVVYNTISTPRGGQYQLTLADGSKVWLNAASTLRFPATFSGTERKVELTGEGYFEVAKNAAMPFKVGLENGVEVEVLGTHFNVMSYSDDEQIKTTLVEGKVKVLNGDNNVILSPNQQAQFTKGNKSLLVDKDADVNKAIAWKNGLFDFDNDNIVDILRQLSRWYDVQIQYVGNMSCPIL